VFDRGQVDGTIGPDQTRPVNDDVAIDAKPGDAAVREDVQAEMGPRSVVVDR